MARQGVWQLQKLVFHYCEFSGSSRGARTFVQDFLPKFTEQNPQLDVSTALRRGHHPFMIGTYENGRTRAVDMRNTEPGEILRRAVFLRSCQGRKTSKKIKHRHKTLNPSVQGAWRPWLDLSGQLKLVNPSS